MAKKNSSFEVTCPCCNAVLKVDSADKAVIGHTPPPRVKTFNDIEEAARAMKEQDSRRDSIFPAVRRKPEACLRSAGEEVPGGG